MLGFQIFCFPSHSVPRSHQFSFQNPFQDPLLSISSAPAWIATPLKVLSGSFLILPVLTLHLFHSCLHTLGKKNSTNCVSSHFTNRTSQKEVYQLEKVSPTLSLWGSLPTSPPLSSAIFLCSSVSTQGSFFILQWAKSCCYRTTQPIIC